MKIINNVKNILIEYRNGDIYYKNQIEFSTENKFLFKLDELINFFEKFKHVSCLPPVILLKIYCSFVQMKYTTFSPKYTRHTKGKLY